MDINTVADLLQELAKAENERLNSYILKNRWNGEKNKSKFNAIYEDIMKESLNKNNSNSKIEQGIPLVLADGWNCER